MRVCAIRTCVRCSSGVDVVPLTEIVHSELHRTARIIARQDFSEVLVCVLDVDVVALYDAINVLRLFPFELNCLPADVHQRQVERRARCRTIQTRSKSDRDRERKQRRLIN